MSDHQQTKLGLEKLANLQISLKEKGGPAPNGKLFEEILTLEEELLKNFGLPGTAENEQLLWFTKSPTKAELDETIKQLQERATDYLLSNARTDLQILHDAKEFQQNPFMVLPELNVSTHSYTLFVYNEILLKGKDTLDNVLHELKLANSPDVLSVLGNLEQHKIDVQKATHILKERGLRHLETFISRT